MKNIKIIGIALVLLLSSKSVLSQFCETTEKAGSEVVMTEAELESFLAKVADLRRKKLREQKELRNKKELAELRNKYNSTRHYGDYDRDISSRELYREIDRLNRRIDRMSYQGGYYGGRDNSTIIMPGRDGSYVYDGGRAETYVPVKNDDSNQKAIWELERKLDSLKSVQKENKETSLLQAQLDDLKAKLNNKPTEKVIVKKVDKRSMIEDLLAKFKNFKKQIFFDNNSSKLNTNDLTYLSDIADILKKHSELSVVLEGWASTRGNSQYNKRLSMKRAEIVKSALVSNGIEAKRVVSSFQGEDKGSSEDHARRVDITVILK